MHIYRMDGCWISIVSGTNENGHGHLYGIVSGNCIGEGRFVLWICKAAGKYGRVYNN